ncbi:MAG: hypothetical protein SVK54_09235, partial [candidate division WOR-3 bacterium]|nr:hypothetical protein [candidate division WOR-3 bacterium]
MKNIYFLYLLFTIPCIIFANTNRADYDITVILDTLEQTLTGTEEIIYKNNSDDTLNTVNLHLTANYFAENGDYWEDHGRHYNENKSGYIRIDSIYTDSSRLQFTVNGTMGFVELDKPLMPGSL